MNVDDKGITVLLGSSGSGKSTLLNILSGQDKDFEGELYNEISLDYITQDFQLFENLSIMDNLLLISSDNERIRSYLNQFSLIEHANKKVKKCSNGQKKRVQFIRALLQSPGLLLCDEPTAALDHDNAELLMQQLKQISEHVQIFLVTHDIALAEKYADRILYMENGQIIKDEKLHDTELAEKGETRNNKNFSETLKAVILQLKSRPIDTVFMIFISFILSASLFACSQIFQNVDEQTQSKYIWDNGLNHIVTKIDDKNKVAAGLTSTVYEYVYENFDVYQDLDIQSAIQKISDIFAVEAFYDVYLYDNVSRTLTINEWQEESFKKGEDYFYSSQKSPYTKQPSYYPLLASQEQILKDYDVYVHREDKEEDAPVCSFIEINKQNDPVSYEYLKYEDIPEEKLSKCFTTFEKTYHLIYLDMVIDSFHPYELVKGKEIPLILGDMPQSFDEVIVDQKTANRIRYQYGFSSIEDMIGESIEVAIPISAMRFSTGEESPYSFSTIKIAGITPYQNPNQQQVFFLQGGVKETLLKDIVNEDANVSYTIVNFMLDMDGDVEKICDELNGIFPVDQNRFVSAGKLYNNQKDRAYMNPKNFILFSSLALFSMFMILMIRYALTRKQFVKERRILSVYGYSIRLESVLRVGLTTLTGGMIWFLTSSILINQFNEIAKRFNYESFMNFNMLSIFMMILIVYVLHLFIELLFGRKTS